MKRYMKGFCMFLSVMSVLGNSVAVKAEDKISRKGYVDIKQVEEVDAIGVGWQYGGEVWMYDTWEFMLRNDWGFSDDMPQANYHVKGIEKYSNLKEMSIGDFSHFEGTLPKLPKLSCITVLDSGKELDFEVAEYKLPLKQLTAFSIADTQVKHLDLGKLKNTEKFALWLSVHTVNARKRYPQLCTYSGKLDFSKNKKMKRVFIENAKLSELNLSGNSRLESLSLINTKLKKLDLSKNRKLKQLEISSPGKVTVKMRKDVYQRLNKKGQLQLFHDQYGNVIPDQKVKTKKNGDCVSFEVAPVKA